MRFNVFAAGLISLAPALVAAQDYGNDEGGWQVGLPREACDNVPYAHMTGDGSLSGGEAFCASKFKDGILVQSLEFQADNDGVRGMVVTWSDNSFEIFGQMDFKGADKEKRQKIEWDPTLDTFTRGEIWSNGINNNDNRAVGKLVLATSNGGEINLDHKDSDKRTPTRLDIGTGGILLGVAGRCGLGIDRLDFIFSNTPVKSRSVVDMELSPTMEELNLRKSNEERGFNVEYLDEVHHVNRLRDTTTIWLRGERRLSETTSITQSTKSTYHFGMGFDFSVKFGIPAIGEATVGTNYDMYWEESKEKSNTKSNTEEVVRGWQQIASAEPNTAIRCYAWAFAATTVDVTWTGNAVITFEDDTELKYHSKGNYNTARYSRVNTFCEEEPIEDAEDAVETGAKVYENGVIVKRGERSIGSRSKARAANKME